MRMFGAVRAPKGFGESVEGARWETKGQVAGGSIREADVGRLRGMGSKGRPETLERGGSGGNGSWGVTA